MEELLAGNEMAGNFTLAMSFRICEEKIIIILHRSQSARGLGKEGKRERGMARKK